MVPLYCEGLMTMKVGPKPLVDPLTSREAPGTPRGIDPEATKDTR